MSARGDLPKTPVPGEHYWLGYDEMRLHWASIAGPDPARYHPSCLWCGVMQRRDGKPQNPCRGVVKVVLR